MPEPAFRAAVGIDAIVGRRPGAARAAEKAPRRTAVLSGRARAAVTSTRHVRSPRVGTPRVRALTRAHSARASVCDVWEKALAEESVETAELLRLLLV